MKKSVLKLKGIEKWAYIIKEGPEKVELQVRKEYEKGVIDFMTVVCIERGMIAAINSINTKVFLEPLKLLDKDLTRFLEQYFEKIVHTPENTGQSEEGSKKLSKIVNLKHVGYFLLHGGSSRRIISLIERSKDNLLAERFLDILMDHRLSKLFKQNGITNAYQLDSRDVAWYAKEKPKLMRELLLVNKGLKRLLNSNKFEPEVNAKIIKCLYRLGMESSDFYFNILLVSESSEELEAASFSFSEEARHSFHYASEIAHLIVRLMKRCGQLKISASREVLMKLIENLVKKYIVDFGEVSAKIVSILKTYGSILANATKKGEAQPSALLIHLSEIFDKQVCMQILLNVFEKSEDYQKKHEALNQMVGIIADKEKLGPALTLKLKKTGLSQAVLKKVGVYSQYQKAIVAVTSDIIASKYSVQNNWKLVSLFSICPEFSLSYLGKMRKDFEKSFSKLNPRREREIAYIGLQFRKVFSPDTALLAKKRIIGEMKLKRFCGEEWREVNQTLERLKWIEQAVIKHEADPRKLSESY